MRDLQLDESTIVLLPLIHNAICSVLQHWNVFIKLLDIQKC